MDFNNIIQAIAIYAIPVLFAITLHEAAHGYVAHHFGDPTATLMGRVTLNPIRHIDLIGTVLMPLFLYLVTAGSLVFGYAKPVPVDFNKLRNPKRDMIWVAMAGPAANLLMALGWGALLYILLGVGVREHFFIEMCRGGVLWNVVLFVFNLFPLPPLDGGRVLTGLLPLRQALAFSRIERWGFLILIVLIVSGIITKLWLYPLMGFTLGGIELLLTPLKFLLS